MRPEPSKLRKKQPRKDGKHAINLALQGGGAHGAFTWGVLDRFLDEEGLVVEAVTGASAGAVNAALLPPAWRGAADRMPRICSGFFGKR